MNKDAGKGSRAARGDGTRVRDHRENGLESPTTPRRIPAAMAGEGPHTPARSETMGLAVDLIKGAHPGAPRSIGAKVARHH